MEAQYRFNVFGRQVLICRGDHGWQAFYLGAEGKRRPADFQVPDFLEADELEQYLGDLFHESATPNNGEVVRIYP